MNERSRTERDRLADDCLCEFMNELRLNGEPLAQGRPYDPVKIAHTGGQYLKVIGITELPHVRMDPQPERYLVEIWVGNAQEDAAYDISSVMLGTVVGEAMFNPDSILDVEQKHDLFVGSIRLLQRTNEIDARGNPEHFVDIAVSCAEDHCPGEDLTKLRQRLHKLREELDPNFSRWRRRAGRVGGSLWLGLQSYGTMYGAVDHPGSWNRYPERDQDDE
jgi:hypothetical protein